MNPEEVLDVVQLTGAQEELYNLLKSFGLSDGSINNFLGRYKLKKFKLNFDV